MKTYTNCILKLCVLMLSSLLLLSCSKKMNFGSSTVVPAAEGSVKYKKGSNNNYDISVKVLHLADPKKLVPSKNHYVLWMETENNGTKNLGQINSSSGWLSSTLKASLNTSSPFQPKNFFITAEDNADISFPGYQVVMRTE